MKQLFIIGWLVGLATGVRAQSVPSRISVHDPVLIRQDSTWYLFATGRGIAVWSSADRQNWTRQPPVFAEAPAWATGVVPTFRNHIWAPDISEYGGTYYLYYSVSAFGKNTSAIGVTTARTLNPTDPAYGWTDHGIVVRSVPGQDDFNAIDPNLVTDEAGTPFLSFGSFWGGLQLVRLRPDRLAPAQPLERHVIAARPRQPGTPAEQAGAGAIEAPFIVRRGGYYYLFASYDYCCRGVASTYHVRVGRARNLTGPYLDEAGTPLTEGGGTLVVRGDAQWHGVGHVAVVPVDGVDYLICHGYDATDGGKSKLLQQPLVWSAAGWPTVATEP